MEICWTKDIQSQIYKDVLNLRLSTFVAEFKSHINVEISEEDECEFAALYKDKEIVATGRIFIYDDNTARLQRIAVKKGHRGQGYGQKLIKHMEEKCQKKDIRNIEICASINALEFYKKLGYKEKGKYFMRSNAEHIWVFKAI